MLYCLYRTRQLKSVDVVQACLDRIDQTHRLLNCVVERRDAEALKEAKEVDDYIAKNPDVNELLNTKPFYGVPFTTKESNQAKGENLVINIVFVM